MKKFILSESEINQVASLSSINRGNVPYLLLGTYGALMDPSNGQLAKRTKSEFKRLGIDINAENMEEYLLGFYQINNQRIVFQKKAGEIDAPEGKATIDFSFGDYAIIAIYAVPRVALKQGSALMQSEGCQRAFAPYHASNHYTLWANAVDHKITPVENDARPNPEWFKAEPNNFFIFVAGQEFLAHERLYPPKDYLDSIQKAYQWGIEQGYNIDQDYINSLVIRGTKI